METDMLVQLDPAQILPAVNSRFNLKKSRIESLKASILEAGGILTPVEVEPQNGDGKYSLVAGFYRHAAATEINKEGGGILVPAIVRAVPDPAARLRHQLIENMERENQSPMDQAVAIQQLLEAGVARPEIRRMFARPGGKKGTELQPASNAWLNITLALLQLPKAVQEKIHDGRVGIAAAYELGKVTPEKRAAVLERAERERMSQIEEEAKDEAKYLAEEAKVAKAKAEVTEVLTSVEQAREAVEAADKLVDDKTTVLRTAQKQDYLKADKDGKKKILESVAAAETDVKAAQKTAKDAKNKLAKLMEKAKSAEEQAAEKQAKLDMAKRNKKTTKKTPAVGPDDVKKAAAAEGVGATVPLKMAEARQGIKDLTSDSHPPRIKKLAVAVLEFFDGKHTPKELGIEWETILAGKSK